MSVRASHSPPAAALAAILAACAALPNLSLGEAPAECDFPPGTALAFAGPSSVGRLGLETELGDIEGWFYITAEVIQPASQALAPGRMFCVQSGDAFISSGGVPDDWMPPPGQ